MGTCPELSVIIFSVAFAWAIDAEAQKAPAKKNISHFNRFIFPVC
jgi:hypothetical protein